MPIPASPFTPAAKLPFSTEALAAADELYPLGSDTLSMCGGAGLRLPDVEVLST